MQASRSRRCTRSSPTPSSSNHCETESAAELESSHAPKPQSLEQVAEAILDLIRTGAEQADLVPEQFGGSDQE
jgi:hypothetical protein